MIQADLKISLIISVYKNIDFLDIVLRSVDRQSYKNFEVIIAEDNDGREMADFLALVRKKYSFDIIHVFHEDTGFRKTRILNKAVKVSTGDFLVIIDGDCMMHRNFLKEYARQAQDNTCLFGRRMMLSKKLTDKLLNTRDLNKLHLWSIFFSGNRKIEEGLYLPFLRSFRKKGLKGCNLGLPKKLLEKINGYDEDYEEPWGGEDSDLERRLRLAGARFKCTRFLTIQYHLYHQILPRNVTPEGLIFITKKKTSTEWFCRNGLQKNENPE
jgi:glycosyltransferase involved in cell wall biosynthesis